MKVFAIFFSIFWIAGCGTDPIHGYSAETNDPIPLHLTWQPDQEQVEKAFAHYETHEKVLEWIESTRVCIKACFEDGGVDFFIWSPPETCNCIRQEDQ